MFCIAMNLNLGKRGVGLGATKTTTDTRIKTAYARVSFVAGVPGDSGDAFGVKDRGQSTSGAQEMDVTRQ